MLSPDHHSKSIDSPSEAPTDRQFNLSERSIEDIRGIIADVLPAEDWKSAEDWFPWEKLLKEMCELPDENPEHGIAVISALVESDDPEERWVGGVAAPRLLRHDFDLGARLTIKSITDPDLDVASDAADHLEKAVANLEIRSEDIGGLVARMATNMREASYARRSNRQP